MSNISAELIAYSQAPNKQKIATFELEYPRFLHSELMTHRVFSRNAMSSRAVPIEKMIEQVRNYPATPIHWGKNQSGMQAKEELKGDELVEVKGEWFWAAKNVADSAEFMSELGAHKQVANRILEPFQTMKTVLTATEFENFFWLRNHCYSADTEVLTETGWKLIKDVKFGEKVVSLNLENQKLESSKVIDTVEWKSEGKAIKFEGIGVDLLVSDQHRMVVVENNKATFKLARDLVGTNPRLLKNCTTVQFSKESFEYKQGKFLGFYLGNGWKYKSEASGNSGIVVCKGDKHGEEVIRCIAEIASELFTGNSVTIYEKSGVYHCKIDGKSVYEEFKVHGNSTEKNIPDWVWETSGEMKAGVFDGMLLADSNILQQSGGLKYYTSSRKMADSFQRLCLEVGVSGTLATDNRVGSVSEGVDSQGKTYSIKTKNIGYRVSVNMHRNTPKLKKQPSVVEYNGDFVCISLEKNHTLYVRRNGKTVWSGNCDAQPEIRRLAEVMLDCFENEDPAQLYHGDWHTPYFGNGQWYAKRDEVPLEDALAISASCCAQVSFRSLDDTLEKAKRIYERLVVSEPVHASPFEHQGCPIKASQLEGLYSKPINLTDVAWSWQEGITHVDKAGNFWSGNFKGFIQHRQLIPNNVKIEANNK